MPRLFLNRTVQIRPKSWRDVVKVILSQVLRRVIKKKGNVSSKGSRKNNVPSLGDDPSRLAALLVPDIPRVGAVLAPCQTGVSAPKNGKLFLREP